MRWRTRARGVTALTVLIAIAIGMPATLAATIGNPLGSLSSLGAGRLTDRDVIAVLVAIFWLAWLTFVVPLVIEIATIGLRAITGRTLRPIHLPLLRTQQHLAHNLLTAAAFLLPVSSMLPAAATPPSQPARTAATATVMTAESHPGKYPSGNSARTGPVGTSSGQQRQYVIPAAGGMRSYWALAEHYLGDGTRWREIWHLNEGRVHADGTTMDTPRHLHAGWTILIPATDAPAPAPSKPDDLLVQAGDSLTGLAARHKITSWHDLWRANAGRAEPDGERFTDPNLVKPGWTLTLPGRAGGRPPDRAPRSAGKPGTTRPREPSTPPADHPGQIPGRGPSRSPIGSREMGDPAPRPAPSGHPAPPTAHVGGQAHRRSPAVPIGVGLAAIAAVAALDRARRIAQRRRGIGRRPVPSGPELRGVEAELRQTASRAGPVLASVQLAMTMAGFDRDGVRAVIAHDRGDIELVLTAGAAGPLPPPFTGSENRWRLAAGDAGFTFAVDDREDACPVLVPIGRINDADVLINLAATGPVSIAGDPEAVASYLGQLVTAMHAAPWADRVQLHVPTFLASHLSSTAEVTVDPDGPVLPRRLPTITGGEEPGWITSPVYLFIGWTDPESCGDLISGTREPATDVYAIFSGPHPGTDVWTLDGDQLTTPGFDQPVQVAVPSPPAAKVQELIDFVSSAPCVPAGDRRLPDTGSDAPPSRNVTSQQLNVLGPVELEGIERPRRSQTLNLLTYLALHRRGADHDTLATAIWTQSVSGKTLRNRITEARALVDGAITDGPHWRLDDSVSTDWQQFTALAAGTPQERRQALLLVRGRPFEGLDYADWIDLEGIRSEVEATVVDLAVQVAEDDLGNGDPEAALAAARAGLAASRYDERLHRLAIRAAEAAGHTGVVATLKQEMRVALDLDIEPDDTIEAATLQLYADLRRPRAAVND